MNLLANSGGETPMEGVPPQAGGAMSSHDWQEIMQMLAERRSQNPIEAHLSIRPARREAVLPRWSGQTQDFGFFIGRLEIRIENDFAPYFDDCTICLDMVDTIPERLKPRVANWFEGEHQYFADFLQDFEHRVAQSGGDEAHTPLGKVQKLKAAINGKLRRTLIGLRLPNAYLYDEWVAEMKEIALELEGLADYRPRGARHTRTRLGFPKSSAAEIVPMPQRPMVDEEGDVTMGGVNAILAGLQRLVLQNEIQDTGDGLDEIPQEEALNAVGQAGERNTLPRAPWRTPQELKRLMAEGVCVRCARSGHFARNCTRFRRAQRGTIMHPGNRCPHVRFLHSLAFYPGPFYAPQFNLGAIISP
ncbi:hypothetical protein K3495_g11593 [Podosphaera aphanis]|nr:hypothetical protein K3495_g11593 [Podosphaera aphanis]